MCVCVSVRACNTGRSNGVSDTFEMFHLYTHRQAGERVYVSAAFCQPYKITPYVWQNNW